MSPCALLLFLKSLLISVQVIVLVILDQLKNPNFCIIRALVRLGAGLWSLRSGIITVLICD
mgnify:CR=1 FL=1